MIDQLLYAVACILTAALFAGSWLLLLYLFFRAEALEFGLVLFALSFFVMFQTGRHG